eukprot:TRINITY_DN6239_c0_g1_i2.p1 TRINITY_DN6239_c0_g1~~TRINITY_DN6239_c0_g1_i2.p1  ORF type:complete len:373 (+),score=67.50 TRINITY_DN6239_c0_g1_i2:196-1314(+)
MSNNKTQSWQDDPQQALSFFIQHFLSFTNDIAHQAEEFITYDGASSPIRPSSRNSSRSSSPSPHKRTSSPITTDVTLTICTQCERVVRQKPPTHSNIRISREEDDVKWTTLPQYLRNHHLNDSKNFKFSHGLCFSCFKRESDTLDSSEPLTVLPSETTTTSTTTTSTSTNTDTTSIEPTIDSKNEDNTSPTKIAGHGGIPRCNSVPELLLPQHNSQSPLSVSTASVEAPQPRVLVVDDNRLQRSIHQRMVAKAGFECDVAKDGHEAIKMLKEKQYSLVLMDCMLGDDIDGWTTTTNIRELEKECSIYSSNCVRESLAIVALTGLPLDSELVLKCTNAGMDDVVHKPISPSAMQHLLDSVHTTRSRSTGSFSY